MVTTVRGTDKTIPSESDAVEMADTIAPSTQDTRLQPDTKSGVAVDAERWSRGDSVGRFTILRTLGAGGMGVVYLAYDPELDRKVALKLIRGGSSEAARTRLYREAQALGKLSHPNVVAVHDVGTHRGQVWVAMEFVVGQTLMTWCEEVKPSWKQVVEVIKQAANGVAAAHRAGLLHRDLKPDNIMVGSDGRVRVMDFGLVRSDDSHEAQLMESASRPALSVELTAAGAVMGTPAYMAAEQFAGLATDARTDQFALCATLWEALYGERAFAGETFAELAVAVSAGARRPAPAGAKVPAWVRRVAQRGLDPDPDKRYESVDELLAALEADPRPRRWFFGVTASALVIAGTLTVTSQVQHRRAVAACQEQASAVERVWNAATSKTLRSRLAHLEEGYARAAGERVMPWLDEYAQAWKRTHFGLCMAQVQRQPESLFVRNEPPSLSERTQACMDQGRDQFTSLLEQFSHPDVDGPAVLRGVSAASELPRPALCEDSWRLQSRRVLPEGEATRLTVRRLQKQLAEVAMLTWMGRFKRGISLAIQIQQEADELGWEPLQGAIALSRSRLYDELGDYEAAQQAAQRGFLLASTIGDNKLGADAAGQQAWLFGWRLEQHDEAMFWGHLEGVLLDRAGVPNDDLRRAKHFKNLGTIYLAQSSLDRAREHYERALELREQVLGPEHPAVADAMSNLGIIYGTEGANERAEEVFIRTLKIRERAFGTEHPDVASSLNNLGNVYKNLGTYDKAKGSFEKALDIREKILDKNHPLIARTLGNLGEIYLQQGAYVEARDCYQRASEVMSVTLSKDHPELARSLVRLGEILVRLGDHDNAERHLDTALKIFADTLGAVHPNVADVLLLLGDISRSRGAYDQAKVQYERALAIREQALGDDHIDVAQVLHSLGNLYQDQGIDALAGAYYEQSIAVFEQSDSPQHPRMGYVLTDLGILLAGQQAHARASSVLAQALVIGKQNPGDPAQLARTRFAYAQTLWHDKDSRPRARQLAQLARDGYRESGAQNARLVAEVEAWLTQR